MTSANAIEREASEERRKEREALSKGGLTKVEAIWCRILDDDARWSAFQQYALCEMILMGSEHPGRDYQGHVAEMTFGTRTLTPRKFRAGDRQRAIHAAITGSVGLHLPFPRRATAWRMATVMDFAPQTIADFGQVENKPMYSGGEKTRRASANADVIACADLAAEALTRFDMLGA